jgi:SagB-type dehydrogenase family enzyme
LARERPARAPLLHRSTTLIAWPAGDQPRFCVQNVLLGWRVFCGPAGLALISGLPGPATANALLDRLAELGDTDPPGTLDALIQGGLLVAERSDLARRQREWRRSWRWGPVAGAFHRSLRDLPFLDVEETRVRLARRARREPPPPALPVASGNRQGLPEPRVRRGVLPHLLRRESLREMTGAPITARDVADVLFSGLGVRAVVRDPVQGDLPLKLAPSGGARNAIEGWLLALRVKGLPAGVYRYSGLHRDLERVSLLGRDTPPPSALLGGQPWADGAAAVVFLVATFERAAWKYRHALSYRMLTLEAGHVAQNQLVAAAALGLAAWPSGALSDTLVEEVLGFRPPGQAALYAVVLGRPAGGPQPPSRSRSARSSRSGGKSGSASAQRRASRSASSRASPTRPRASSARARSRRLRG